MVFEMLFTLCTLDKHDSLPSIQAAGYSFVKPRQDGVATITLWPLKITEPALQHHNSSRDWHFYLGLTAITTRTVFSYQTY